MDNAQQHADTNVRHEYNYEMHVQAITESTEISYATDAICP